MIKSVKMSGGFIEKLPCLRGKSFKLNDSVCVLFGPNGCGKSTFIRGVGAVGMVPEAGGWSSWLTPLSHTKRVDMMSNPKYPRGVMNDLFPGKGTDVDGEWDGSPAYMISKMTGTYKELHYAMGGGNTEGLLTWQELMQINCGEFSTGQTRRMIFDRFVAGLSDVPDIAKKPSDYDRHNYVWKEYWDLFEAYVKTLPRDGRSTLLLDEPESGMDILAQRELWEKEIPALGEKFQVIVATHSPQAILCFDPTWQLIDLQKGYFKKVEAALVPKKRKVSSASARTRS